MASEDILNINADLVFAAQSDGGVMTPLRQVQFESPLSRSENMNIVIDTKNATIFKGNIIKLQLKIEK